MVKITEGPGAPTPSSRSEGPEGVAKPFTMKSAPPKSGDTPSIDWPSDIKKLIDQLNALEKDMHDHPEKADEDARQCLKIRGTLVSRFYDKDIQSDPKLRGQLDQVCQALYEMHTDGKIADNQQRARAYDMDLLAALSNFGT